MAIDMCIHFYMCFPVCISIFRSAENSSVKGSVNSSIVFLSEVGFYWECWQAPHNRRTGGCSYCMYLLSHWILCNKNKTLGQKCHKSLIDFPL